MEMKMVKGLIGLSLFGILLATGVEAAQVTTSAGGSSQSATSTSASGDFEKLSPGDQKIARALFQNQSTGEASVNTKPLSLDEIAAMKLSGQGWARVFDEMKSRRLVRQRNLGQVVNELEAQQGTSLRSSIPSTVGRSGRTQVDVSEDVNVGGSTSMGQGRSVTGGGGLSISGGFGARGGLRVR